MYGIHMRLGRKIMGKEHKMKSVKIVATFLSIVMILTGVNLEQVLPMKAATDYVTLYFIDNTKEQWISNNNAKIKAIDNSNGHEGYWMTKMNETTWSVDVPKSANNITFNRYKADKTTQWNSWSAGGRSVNNAYYANGREYGHWEIRESGFQEGDVIYLDVSEFSKWENAGTPMYVNFTDASKEDNGGKNIEISRSNKSMYNPHKVKNKVEEHVYRYTVTNEDEGATELRFWRGNDTTLWNCSVLFSYEDYLKQKNCVIVTGWTNSGKLSVYKEDKVDDSIEISFDTSNYNYQKDCKRYMIVEKVDNISGEIKSNNKILSVRYEILDAEDRIISKGDIEASSTFVIKNPQLYLADNKVVVYVETEAGVNSNQLIVFNASEENLNGLIMDTTDSDGDRLTDYFETALLNTDSKSVDTDKDGLSDYQEILQTLTDPTVKDTDNNDVLDFYEDSDKDGLANNKELEAHTELQYADSDNDGLSDGEEINKYKTNPIISDTDGDTISDGDEIVLGLDPLDVDTDHDKIDDNKELFEQEYRQEIVDKTIKNISVGLECAGLIDNVVTIEDVSNKDEQSANVVGIVGKPYEINVTTEFDTAKIEFQYDVDQLGDTKEEDLALMWYDEKNDNYVLLEESVVDTETNTVSYETTHFSTYLLIDKKIWLDNWREDISYRGEVQYYDITLLVDVSGSMSGSRLKNAKTTLNSFVDALYKKDRASLISFSTNYTLLSGFTNDKEFLKSKINSLYAYGGTEAAYALKYALNYASQNMDVKHMTSVVLICDGDVYYDQSLVDFALQHGISITCINVESGTSSAMSLYAEKTNGYYYHAINSSQLEEIMKKYEHDINDIDPTDTDGDGLYDVYEINGMKLPNGQIIMTDPTKCDSDGDGVSDYEEMGNPIEYKLRINGIECSCTVFHQFSNPWVDNSLGKKYTVVNSMDYIPYTNEFINKLYNEKCVEYINGRDIKETAKTIDGKEIYGLEHLHGTWPQFTLQTRTNTTSAMISLIVGGYAAGYSHASDLLSRYMNNTRGTYEYNAKKFIKMSGPKTYFRTNMFAFMDACEKFAKDGETVIVANSKTNYLTGVDGEDMIDAIFCGQGDLYFGVNGASAGIVAEITKDGLYYTMKYKYYLIDYYDWDSYLKYDFYIANKNGYCCNFTSLGVQEGTISWKLGNISNALAVHERMELS